MNVTDPKIKKRLDRLRLKCRRLSKAAKPTTKKKPKPVGGKKSVNKQLRHSEFMRRSLKVLNEVRLNKLAQPKAIRLQPWPNPKLYHASLPVKISHAALHGTFSDRILELAEPKWRLRESSVSCCDKIKLWSPNNFPRTNMLAKPKPVVRTVHRQCLTTENDVDEYHYWRRAKRTKKYDQAKRHDWLTKIAAPKKLRYPPDTQRRGKKKPRLLTDRQMQISVNRLAYGRKKKTANAVADVPSAPRPVPRKPRTLAWVDQLSVPRRLPSEAKLDIEYDPFIVSRAALKATCTPRIEELARPKIVAKELDTGFKKDAFTIPPNALKYKATARIKQLAKPRNVATADEADAGDTRVAFTIARSALKYKPTERIKELAVPRSRGPK